GAAAGLGLGSVAGVQTGALPILPSWLPPTQTQLPAAYPGWLVSESVQVSVFSVGLLSTGLVPERSLLPVPSAVSVKSLTVLVPPLSLTTTLRRCSLGATSSLVMVQVTLPPSGTVTVVLAAFIVPPSHDHSPVEL